jgi:hypothetical protein
VVFFVDAFYPKESLGEIAVRIGEGLIAVGSKKPLIDGNGVPSKEKPSSKSRGVSLFFEPSFCLCSVKLKNNTERFRGIGVVFENIENKFVADYIENIVVEFTIGNLDNVIRSLCEAIDIFRFGRTLGGGTPQECED